MTELPLFAWSPARKVFLFPSARRRRLIIATARVAAQAKSPDKSIRALLTRIRSAHERKGLGPSVIAADLRDLEMALRVHVFQLLAERGRSA
jgi:hypothetical protein